VFGFLLSMAVGLIVVAALLMMCFSFAVAVVFHAMRGMYLHAERLLAKAGRQGAMGRGISHPEQSGGRAQRRSAQAQRGRLLGNPLRRARAEPSARFGFLIRAHQAHRIFRVALRQEQAAVVGSEKCAAVAAREETPPENEDARHPGCLL
jgi:hypothetical protein